MYSIRQSSPMTTTTLPSLVSCTHAPFVLEPPERGALDRRRVGIEGIDLRDPAEPVRLVAVQIGFEPGMGFVPAEAPIRRPDAVALFDRASRVRGERPEEESVEVLFARQVGAPGRESHGAVVERAQNVLPIGSSILFTLSSPEAGPPIRIALSVRKLTPRRLVSATDRRTAPLSLRRPTH